MKKRMIRFGAWLGIILFLLPAVAEARNDDATPDGIVISVRGQVYRQSDQGQPLLPVRSGFELTNGSVLRLEAESQIKILTAAGQMITFEKPGQVRYSGDQLRPAAEYDVLAVLSALFGVDDRRRVPSARELDDSFSLWLNCLSQPKSTPVDLEKIFELMALYDELNFKNRILALSTFLTRQYPDHPTYLNLSTILDDAIRINQSWEIVLNEKKVSASRQPGSLTFNDHLQVVYRSDSESFLYLYLSSYSAGERLQTKRLFPLPDAKRSAGTGVQARVAASTGLILPAKNKAYIVDRKPGNEVIWGWSCYGPLVDETVVETHKARFERHLRQSDGSLTDLQKIEGPGTCHTLLIKQFKHI